MERLTVLQQRESVWLDADRIEALYLQLGETTAQDVVCRTLEQLAAQLDTVERCYRECRPDEMRKNSHSMIAIADRIGMSLLGYVAEDVTRCIDLRDDIALSATLARLMRIAEHSLCEIWEAADTSF